MRSLALFALLLLACSSGAPPSTVADAGDASVLPPEFTVLVAPAQLAAVADWAAQTRLARVVALSSVAPLTDLMAGRGEGIRIAAIADLTTCTQCYHLDHPTGGYVVHGDGVLGLQYGLTHVLEALGYRFFHPFDGHAPASPATATVDASVFGQDYVPEQTERALELWTLHPIESQAFWVPSSDHLNEAHAVLDWVVRNRGNTVYIAALDDIVSDPTTWRPHMLAILNAAHLRGLRMGIGVQLFGGASSLQNAYTLLPGDVDPDNGATMTARWHTLLDGMPFDVVNLSFGEFSGVDPDTFISATNTAYSTLQTVAPGTGMTATIHVGCYPSLQVTYMGQSMQYYFLVQYANPAIVPWVHTVMYDTLFDPVGGAYNCTDFADHRDFLLARLAHHQDVGYNPESAYWIDFDIAVPQYLPVYMYARYRDQSLVQQQAMAQGGASLQRSVEFSSGWEWGYWQNDAAVLRNGFKLPDHWSAPVEDMFAPWGSAGTNAAAQITALGVAQWNALVTQQLAPYIAARDALLDAGETVEMIVSQPSRPTLMAVSQYSAAQLASFTTNVLTPLDALATATDAALAALPSGGPMDPWLSELADGIAVDSARAHFASALWHAAASFNTTHSDGGYLAMVQAALANGQAVVARRHAALHWPEPMALLTRFQNPTIYPYGYLYFADSLCYWQRELAQLRELLMGQPDTMSPACVLIS